MADVLTSRIGAGTPAPIWKVLAVATVKEAAYNPAKRTEGPKQRRLVRSMANCGLWYPILVDAEYRLIDGHRRLAAARELGWETIEARVIKSEDREDIYATVNDTAARMSGNDSLAIWLKNRKAVAPRAAKGFAEMEDVLGLPAVKRLCSAGLSARVFQTAKRIGRYCADESAENIRAVVGWLSEIAVIGQVMKALERGESPALIKAAIRKMKPLQQLSGVESN